VFCIKMCDVVGACQCLGERTANPCPKGGFSMLLWNVGTHLVHYTGIIQNTS
jgi:hypothetical protein